MHASLLISVECPYFFAGMISDPKTCMQTLRMISTDVEENRTIRKCAQQYDRDADFIGFLGVDGEGNPPNE